MEEKFECKYRKCNCRKKLRRKQFFDELQALQIAKKTKGENNHHFFLNGKKSHSYNICSQGHKSTFGFSQNQPTFVRRSQRLQEKTKGFKSAAPHTDCLQEIIGNKPATVTSNHHSPFGCIETPQISPPDSNLDHPEPFTTPITFNGFTNTTSNFNERFRRQVKVPVVQTALEKLRISIAEKVREINSVLNGEAQPEPMNKTIKRKPLAIKTDDENYPNFPLLSPSHWIYKTPPKQRINIPESSCNDTLKPFVYEVNDKTSNIYEFDKGVYKYVNVNKLSDPNVLIDSRFMQPINKNVTSVCNLGIEDVTLQCVSPNQPYWKIKSPQEAPPGDNPFGMCTERPKKKQCYLHSIFPVETYEKVETEEEFNNSFSMLGEDTPGKKTIFKTLRF